jgi:hypothetical protein
MKTLRKWWLARRVAHLQREVNHLLEVKDRLGPALDCALRDLGNARVDLVFFDTGRPPVTHAQGPGRRDGVVRQIEANEAALRG